MDEQLRTEFNQWDAGFVKIRDERLFESNSDS